MYMLGKVSLGIVTPENASVLQPYPIILVHQPVNTECFLLLCPSLPPTLSMELGHCWNLAQCYLQPCMFEIKNEIQDSISGSLRFSLLDRKSVV